MSDEQEQTDFEGALIELKRRNKQWGVFVEHYLTNGFNGRQAALSAGYAESSASVQAHRLITNDNVARVISLGVAQLQMAPDEVLIRLAAMARGDVGHFVNQAEDGSIVLDLNSEAAQKHLGLIRELEVVRTEKTGKHGTSSMNKVKLKLHDAKDALKVIAQHHGLLKDQLVLEDGPERARRAQEERRERLTQLEQILREHRKT